jgi:hypothetical protein
VTFTQLLQEKKQSKVGCEKRKLSLLNPATQTGVTLVKIGINEIFIHKRLTQCISFVLKFLCLICLVNVILNGAKRSEESLYCPVMTRFFAALRMTKLCEQAYIERDYFYGHSCESTNP